MGGRCRFLNTTREAILAADGRLAASLWNRLKGLLGSGTLPHGDGLLIRPCQNIHTFFMAYPIDVLFLDRHNRVVGLHQALRPFRISRFVWRACSALELPAGTIERTGTQRGDTLRIEPVAPGLPPQP